jgi:hypothetical protein
MAEASVLIPKARKGVCTDASRFERTAFAPGSAAGVPILFSVRSFPIFTLLTVGTIAHTGPCTATAILLGSGLSTALCHHRVHRFFNAGR